MVMFLLDKLLKSNNYRKIPKYKKKGAKFNSLKALHEVKMKLRELKKKSFLIN